MEAGLGHVLCMSVISLLLSVNSVGLRFSLCFMYFYCSCSLKIILFLPSIRDAVQDFLHEIYFLPDHPELEKIKAVLQEYRKVFNVLLMVQEITDTTLFPSSVH